MDGECYQNFGFPENLFDRSMISQPLLQSYIAACEVVLANRTCPPTNGIQGKPVGLPQGYRQLETYHQRAARARRAAIGPQRESKVCLPAVVNFDLTVPERELIHGHTRTHTFTHIDTHTHTHTQSERERERERGGEEQLGLPQRFWQSELYRDDW